MRDTPRVYPPEIETLYKPRLLDSSRAKMRPARAYVEAVAPSLVALHVAPNAKRLAAARVRALERLLSSMRVAVNAQAAGTAERLVACHANVAVLGLWVGRAL